ncbi:MAG: hypothetical protein ABJE10_14895 [bacterium]
MLHSGLRLTASSLALLFAPMLGCRGRASTPVVATAPAAAAIDDSTDNIMRGALANAVQARGNDAVAAMRSIDSSRLAMRYRATRACMLQRLGARVAPTIELSDPFLRGVLATYHEYWLRSMRDEHPSADNEAWLLEALNARVAAAGEAKGATLDDLEAPLTSLARARGYHVLFGVTSPLREFMLWKTETDAHYDVRLPESTQAVTVVFMSDFASLGWVGFATCDRHHTGGWTKPDRLYAVRSAYDLDSEDFRVSYLAHEGQHFSDAKRFPDMKQERLEYRAKLVELAVGKASVYELLDAFAGNVSSDPEVPHSFANGRVVRDMAARLSPGKSDQPRWRDVSVERINAAAAALLREDSAKTA